MGNVTHLVDRPMYGFTQVDQLLGLRAGTAARWINGYTRQDRDYQPIVRQFRTDADFATWGEFVECRFLAEYREAGVPVLHLRPVVARLREQLQTRYPLATASLWTRPEGREIVARIQAEESLPRALYVVRTDDALLPLDWTPNAQRFQDSVVWSDDEPTKVWADGPEHIVAFDPDRAFGQPAIRGVPTAVLAELVRAGDPVEMVADLYELREDQVRAAFAYEERHTAA